MMMSPPPQVVVVGAGAVGLCTAFALASSNKVGSVRVLDPDLNIPLPRASSFRSAASCRVQFSTRENIALSIASSKFFQSPPFPIAQENYWRKARYLFLATTKEGDAISRDNVAMQRGMGTSVSVLHPKQLHTCFPWLDNVTDVISGSLGDDNLEGFIDAHAFFSSLRNACIKMGVIFEPKRIVDAIVVNDKITELVVTSSSSTQGHEQQQQQRLRSFTHVVCAMGAWSNLFANMIGLHLPVRARRRVVYVIRPTSSQVFTGNTLLCDPSGVWFRNESNGVFIAGKSPDASVDRDFDPEDPYAFETATDADAEFFNSEIWPSLSSRASMFTSLQNAPSSWAGWYDYNTVDQNLLIGSFPSISNCVFACGSSGHGLQHAPAIGRAVSELCIDGRFQTLDLSRLHVARTIPVLERNVV